MSMAAPRDAFTNTDKPMRQHTLLLQTQDGCSAGCGKERDRRPQGRFVHPVEAEESDALVFKMQLMAAQHRIASADGGAM